MNEKTLHHPEFGRTKQVVVRPDGRISVQGGFFNIAEVHALIELLEEAVDLATQES